MEKRAENVCTTAYQNNKDLLQKPTIKNLSSRPLSALEEKLLNLGLNFSLPIKNVGNTMIDTAATLELRMMDMELTDNDKNKIRTGVARIMAKHIKKEQIQQRWEKWINNSIRSLLQDTTICITKADKANCVVIMDRETYREKMAAMIHTPC
ncbi:hypothetical protein Fcan01_05615 [Folsomia candida]|uniref:Uncharacterized protein n=1 Tax=Folsomia candida TaxID=158441 RepID=A0A226EQR8_FOLCA|nr:hypothetical protein Fcan01_05615 [Folsomia candida]